MGDEFFRKGAHVQLGPAVNVQRVPVNGRNFEYLSGEDPVLGAQMVGPLVRGIQDQGVLANIKHFVDNSQETNRGDVSENVDERLNFEMYYPPFKSSFDAGVGSLMCSYNKINNVWSCENNSTLNTHLRAYMGYEGYTMSDWGGTHSIALDKGLD
jgi:beta-glucosidase